MPISSQHPNMIIGILVSCSYFVRSVTRETLRAYAYFVCPHNVGFARIFKFVNRISVRLAVSAAENMGTVFRWHCPLGRWGYTCHRLLVGGQEASFTGRARIISGAEASRTARQAMNLPKTASQTGRSPRLGHDFQKSWRNRKASDDDAERDLHMKPDSVHPLEVDLILGVEELHRIDESQHGANACTFEDQ